MSRAFKQKFLHVDLNRLLIRQANALIELPFSICPQKNGAQNIRNLILASVVDRVRVKQIIFLDRGSKFFVRSRRQLGELFVSQDRSVLQNRGQSMRSQIGSRENQIARFEIDRGLS